MNKRTETTIGFRDPDYNIKQYNIYYLKYAESNPHGLRGGLTPLGRKAELEEVAPPGTPVFEVGFGMGLDADVLEPDHPYGGGDIGWHFIETARAKGRNARYFDANKDPIPYGYGALIGHLSIGIHLIPQAFTRLLASGRERLEGPRAVFFTAIDGHGHERSERDEEFARDFIYYPKHRLEQMCTQEGLDIKFIRQVVAFNGSVFWHVGGDFKSRYEESSYGERNLHPFGDVVLRAGTLYNGNFVHDLVDDQYRVGLISENDREFIKAAEKAHERGYIKFDEMAWEVNATWAKALAGRDIGKVIEHATDFLNQATRIRELAPAILAICNNNGFGNILVGYEPSWLIEAMAKHLGVDKISSIQWQTETNEHLTGTITGEVARIQSKDDLKKAVASYRKQLEKRLGTSYPRPLIGIGQSKMDTDFLACCDFPILAFTSSDCMYSALSKGFFTDKRGDTIYAGREPFPRWAIINDEVLLAKYLNMVTSDRFAIQPDDPFFKGPLWTCQYNRLNEDFYMENQNPVEIIK